MEESDLIDELVAKGASDEEIEIVLNDFRSKRQAPKEEDSKPFWETVGDYATAGVGAFNRGVSQAVSAPLKAYGAASNWVEGLLRGEEIDAESNPFYKTGDIVQKKTEEINPYNPDVNETFQNVAQGLGQVLPMVATGGASSTGQLASQATKFGAPQAVLEGAKRVVAPQGIIAGSEVGVPEWEAARQAGLSENDAFESLVKNYFVGQTEAIPLQNLVRRLNAFTGGKILEIVKNSGVQALEEAIQEAAQTYATNVMAKADYDPDRDPMFQVLESAKAGGIVGAILPGIGAAVTHAPAATKVKVERKLAETQIDKALEQSSTGDPEIDAQIDSEAAITPKEKEFVESKVIDEAVEEEQADIDQAISEIEKDAKEVAKAETEAKKPKPKEGEKAKPKPVEPDLKASAQRKLEYAQQDMNNAETEEEKRAARKSLAIARQALAQIAGTEGKPKAAPKTGIQKQIEEVTGVKKKPQEPVVIKDPMKAFQQDLIREDKIAREAMTKGVRKGQRMTNENLIKKAQEAMKENQYSQKQISTILTKIRNTNLFTPGSYSKLNDFITKVTKDADYANRLDEAKEINRQIRKRLKNKSIPVNLKPVAQTFTRIPVDETMLGTHLEWGQKILQGLNPDVTDLNKGPVTFNTQEASDYVDKVISDLEEYAVKSEPSEGTADPEERLKELRNAAKFSIVGLKLHDISSYDAREKAVVKSITDLDLNTLNDEQLKRIVRVADNIVENDDLSSAGSIDAIVTAKRNLKNLLDKYGDIKKKDIKSIGKIFGNVSQQHGRIFGDSDIASTMQNLTGQSDMWAGGSQAENLDVKMREKTEDKLAEIKKKYKTDVSTTENGAILRVFSELYKNYGDDSHIELVKKNIEKSISEFERNKDYKVEAEALKKAYSEFSSVQSSADAEAIMQKHPGLMEAWKFFNETFNNETLEPLSKITTELYNKPFRSANNYTHTAQVRVNRGTKRGEELVDENFTKPTIKPQMANTAKTATRRLNYGSAYSLDWVQDQLRGYRESIYDVKTSRAKALVSEVLGSPEFEQLVGGPKNADLIEKMLISGEAIQRGLGRRNANDAVKLLNETTSMLRNIGSVRALGSYFQIPKQYFSVMSRAALNHLGTGSIDHFIKGATSVNLYQPSAEMKALWDQYPIGVRGKRLGGTDRGEAIAREFASQAGKSIVKGFEKANKKMGKFSEVALKGLVGTDVFAARSTWNGYYLQKLAEQGVTDVNLEEEYKNQLDPRRREAAAYAEQKLDETQGPSNPAKLAQISRNEGDGGFNIVKNLLMPFSTFSIGSKFRQIQDVERLIRDPKKAKNWTAFGGDLAEILVYAAVVDALSTYAKPAIKAMLENATGVEPPDEDEEKKARNREKAVKSLMLNQVVPLSIGSIGEYGTAKSANALAWLIQNPEMSYSEWKKETGGFVYDPKEELDWGLLGLGAQPYMETAKDIGDVVQVARGEPVSYDAAGHPKEADLDSDQKKILGLKLMLDVSSMMGWTEAELYRQIQKIYEEQKKEASKTKPKRAPKW